MKKYFKNLFLGLLMVLMLSPIAFAGSNVYQWLNFMPLSNGVRYAYLATTAYIYYNSSTSLITFSHGISAPSVSYSGKRVVIPGTQTGITTSSQCVPTSEYMVVSATGALTNTAAPFISTNTYTSGTVVTLVGGSTDVLTVSDSACFALGSSTRALGAGDVLSLILINGVWYETGFVNN